MTPQFRARTAGLIVQELDDEVLVYDTERARAHCLNRTAALVWRACDGQTPVTEMARRLRGALALDGEGETLVLEALRRLRKAHLLEGPAGLPERASAGSRREALRKLARMAGAASVPLVATIVAPRAAEAQSCVPIGQACTRSSQCCPNNQGIRCCRNGGCGQGVGNCANP